MLVPESVRHRVQKAYKRRVDFAELTASSFNLVAQRKSLTAKNAEDAKKGRKEEEQGSVIRN